MKYVLNNYYILRHDARRTFILGGRNGRKSNGILVDVDWKSMIHPSYAMMLSFFSKPVELDDAVHAIAEFFSISEEKITDFVMHTITATECWHTNMSGIESGFPKNLIIPAERHSGSMIEYRPTDFKFSKLDCESRRMLTAPLSIVWMPNNNCHTACEYCYADRSRHNHVFSMDKIEAFVRDAAQSGVVEILLTGGDFFENPYWEEILVVLQREGYKIDMVSTKKPLSLAELEIFKKFNIRLQVSIDTLSDDIAISLLHVTSDYTSRIREMLRNVNNLNIEFQVATVLTNINDHTDNLESLYIFLNGLDKLSRWELRVAFRSLYSKSDFDKIKSSRYNIDKVAVWIENKQKQSNIKILWSPDDDKTYKKAKGGSKNFEGPICTANMSNMIVLPDGNVTICEQLYWNPEFLIGNVFSDSISSIWTSAKALGLWQRQQDTIREKSPCSRCKDFVDCFTNGNRCFANILKAYGIENSDYPDPRCHLAPDFKNNITHE